MKLPINFNIDGLLIDLGLEDLSGEEKKNFLDRVMSNLELLVGTKIHEMMTEEQQKESQDIDDADDFMEYLKKNDIDFETVVFLAAKELREDLIRDMAYLEGRIDSMKED